MHYGTAAPKFVSGINTVHLDCAKILTDRPVYDYEEQPSVLNGHINHIKGGMHWLYIVRIHVYKEGESIANENKLLSYLGKDVVLYRHREAFPFKDSAGDNVLFRVQEVTPDYFNTPDYKDIIDIRFKSSDYVDLTKSILPEDVMVDSKGLVIQDDKGNYQIG